MGRMILNSIVSQCHPHSRSFSTTSQAAVAKGPHLRMKVNVIHRIDFGVGSMTPKKKDKDKESDFGGVEGLLGFENHQQNFRQ